MIQLGREGFSGSADTQALRNQFAEKHTARLPRLISPELMRQILARLNHGPWKAREDKNIGKEAVPEDQTMVGALNFVVNAPGFLDAIRRITGIAGINRFHGRIYRMLPNSDHYDTWHDDVVDGRLVGMSVNLGPEPYCGGIFRLRSRETTEVLAELPNTGQGDAFLFRISPLLQHIVSTVEGTVPKTAFAGWFSSAEEHLYSRIRGTVAR